MTNISVLQNPIASRIIFIRGQYVMLDKDIARLYMMETRAVNQAVKRNPIKFPERFVFQLTREETDSLASFINDSSMSQDVILKDDSISMSQDVILKRGQNIKKCPLVFTEQGASMLATVLKGDMAPKVTIDCYVKHKHQTSTMLKDFSKFAAQYPKSHCELHTFEKSHDRWLIVDNKVYHFGASLKDLGKRWFAFSMIEDTAICQYILNSLK